MTKKTNWEEFASFKDYFETTFGLKINNLQYYHQALTHNSYANEHKARNLGTYQRLEFLGDAILQKEMSLYFYKQNPGVDEGKLTKERSNAVREETLAGVVKRLGLNNYIRLGNGEIASGGNNKPSILADVFESITAAIYLDNEKSGKVNEILAQWLEQTLIPYISQKEYLKPIKDYKSELQELIQAENRSDLHYVVKAQHPVENNSIEYVVEVILEGQVYGEGIGLSKQAAEQQAAKNCLEKLHLK